MAEHSLSGSGPMKSAEARRIAQLDVAAWLAFAVYLALVVGFAWNPTPLAQGVGAVEAKIVVD